MTYHNPEGMSDIIDIRCALKKKTEQDIRELFSSYGFFEIETPALEYYEMYSGENENISIQDIFKLVDKTGNILVLRPDMTVSACRVAATKIKNEVLPYKLSYISKCFRAEQFGGGKQREFTQCGCEILGENDAYYDALVIKLAIDTAKKAGITDISIQLGQVEFFNGFAEQAGLSKKDCDNLSKLIEAKDSHAVHEYLKDIECDKSVMMHIENITGYFGDGELVKKLMINDCNARSYDALNNLDEILEVLRAMGYEKYVTVDLSMVKKLGYYTGMIFTGNTYQMGFPVLAGGRYDNLSAKMGRDLYATGFSLSLEMALLAASRQGNEKPYINKNVLMSFTKPVRDYVLDILKNETNDNFEILPDSDEILSYAKERGINTVIRFIDKDRVLVIENDITEQYTFKQWRNKWNI